MAKNKTDNFAEKYKQLEQLVVWFEREEAGLEEGVKKLAEGAELVKDLKQYLNTAENKVKELKSKI